MPAFSEEYISQRLAEALNFTADESNLEALLPDPPHPAAVLIPLFRLRSDQNTGNSWQVLLTRRTNTVAEHQGQVAFPGGQADPLDSSPEMTALREAHEEVGVDPLLVRILGRMKSVWTITNYLVTPVVGVIPWPFPIRIAENEVNRVFTIPLAWLADPQHHEIRYRPIPRPYSQIAHQESHPVVYFQTYQDELLWGLSAQIVLNLINILYNKKLAGD